MRVAPAQCIFCGFRGPLTREHIFSRWSHRFLPPRSMKKYESMRGISNPNPADSVHRVVKRMGDIRDWKVQCVCEFHCNNGWMRRVIEDRARPIMIHLIKGEPTLVNSEHQKA